MVDQYIAENAPAVETRRCAWIDPETGKRIEADFDEIAVFAARGNVIPFPGATPQPEALHDDDLTSYVMQLHYAATPFIGVGKLRLSASFPKKNSRAKFQHFRIGDVDGMVAAIKALVRDKGKDTGKNVSIPWFVVHGDAPLAALKETDILAALAIVTDPRSLKGDKYRLNELGAEPSAVLRIGHHQFRNIYLFNRPVIRSHEPALYKLVADASIDGLIPGAPYHSKDTDTVKSIQPMPVAVVVPFGDTRLDVDAIEVSSSTELVDVNLKPPSNYPPSEEYGTR